jgi:hypothetical protein
MRILFRKYCLLLLLAASQVAFAQEEIETDEETRWKSWEASFPARPLLDIVQSQQAYADSVRQNRVMSSLAYTRLVRHRFTLTFGGKKRKISPETKATMLSVAQKNLSVEQQENLVKMVQDEGLFVEGDRQYWMPIQSHLWKIFNEEVAKGAPVTLFTTIFVEHTPDRILSFAFVVSEYQ